MLKHLIMVPTVRDAANAVEQIMFSCTMPTDVVVLDGHAGLAQTINYALTHVLDPERHAYFTKMDDDYRPVPGWQDAFHRAFDHFDHLGALGLAVKCEPKGRTLAYCDIDFPAHPFKVDAESRTGSSADFVEFTTLHSLPGYHFTMPTAVALAVGEIPILAETKYQYYEDGWKSARLDQMGLRYGQVEFGGRFGHLFEYPSSTEQPGWEAKEADVRRSRPEVGRLLADMRRNL